MGKGALQVCLCFFLTGNWYIHNVLTTFVIEQEEPCEARVSSTVPWEREGEIPLRDPIMGKFKKQHDRHEQISEQPTIRDGIS